jgi:hypothetical protein
MSLAAVVAVASYFLIQDAPQKANRWMSAEETKFVVLRNRYAYGADKSGSNDAWSFRDYVSALKVSYFSMDVAYLSTSAKR